MKTLLRKIFLGRYDPMAYWNKRYNPNNAQGETPERVCFDVSYIKRGITGFNTILEIGPGVGRTFTAYKSGDHVTTVDVSRKYMGKLLIAGKLQGVNLKQHHLANPTDSFPFQSSSFPVGIASQVLMHIPQQFIRHTMSELIRVCGKVVVITSYTHGLPTNQDYHVFNHDYFSLCTDLGGVMHEVIMNEGRICFVFRKL